MLKSIRIQNFRGHRDTLIDLERFTSIVGENGTRKNVSA